MRAHSESTRLSGLPSTTVAVDASHSHRKRSQVRARGRASIPCSAATAIVASKSVRTNSAAFREATAIVSSRVRRAHRSNPAATALQADATARAASAFLARPSVFGAESARGGAEPSLRFERRNARSFLRTRVAFSPSMLEAVARVVPFLRVAVLARAPRVRTPLPAPRGDFRYARTFVAIHVQMMRAGARAVVASFLLVETIRLVGGGLCLDEP